MSFVKLALLSLALCLAVGLEGCGSSTTTTSTATTTSSSTTSTSGNKSGNTTKTTTTTSSSKHAGGSTTTTKGGSTTKTTTTSSSKHAGASTTTTTTTSSTSSADVSELAVAKGNALVQAIEKLVCDVASFEEPKLAAGACEKLHKKFPAVSAGDCEQVFNTAWADLHGKVCPEQQASRVKGSGVVKDLEKLVCDAVHFEEEKAVADACNKIHTKFPQVPVAKCSSNLGALADALFGKFCPAEVALLIQPREEETNGVVKALEKLFCDAVGAEETKVLGVACNKIHAKHPEISVAKCSSDLGALWDALFGKVCPTSVAQFDEGLPHGPIVKALEKLMCDAANTEEAKIAAAACGALHAKFPAVPVSDCESLIAAVWGKVDDRICSEARNLYV